MSSSLMQTLLKSITKCYIPLLYSEETYSLIINRLLFLSITYNIVCETNEKIKKKAKTNKKTKQQNKYVKSKSLNALHSLNCDSLLKGLGPALGRVLFPLAVH